MTDRMTHGEGNRATPLCGEGGVRISDFNSDHYLLDAEDLISRR
jgi:hypothetical protein